MQNNTFCVITVEPIEAQTHSAPQNDRLNLSFLNDFNVFGEKWPERVVKWPFFNRKFSGFFFPILKKKGNDFHYVLCCSF